MCQKLVFFGDELHKTENCVSTVHHPAPAMYPCSH